MIKFIKNHKKIAYANTPFAFDIETTSFLYDGRKAATMYIWTFGFFDGEKNILYHGRTWDEFLELLEDFRKKWNLSDEKRIVIYVHNLSYEFQFMQHLFEWTNVFALEERKVCYAVSGGFEFRCSYILSGYSLAKVGENLKKYPAKKMVGDLDYSKIRGNLTPLTEKEMGYIDNDVVVVLNFIREEIENNGSILNIPLTKTGYVRRFCKNMCFYGDSKSHKKSYERKRYMNFMKHLTLDPEEYKSLKRAYAGGFTHANAMAVGKVIKDVESYDFTSSYPAVMISEKFPMSKGEKTTVKSKSEFLYNLSKYCCVFDVRFDGLSPSVIFENPLSESKCWRISGEVVNNGRVVSCDFCETTITDVDYFIFQKFYKWKKIRIGNFWRYRKGYLPRNFILAILDLYEKKTTLKGVEEKEVEYGKSKEMLNSCYGMTVTDIVRDLIEFDSVCGWKKSPADLCDTVVKENEKRGRFLFYPWGVFVTAYARKNLFSGIYSCGEDYIYSDTDSVKIQNGEKHRGYFQKYNKRISRKIETMCKFYRIDFQKTRPKTVKGIEKPLGVWDYEGVYSRFKTLGAKRYMTEKDGKVSITVAGLNKKTAVPYMKDKYGEQIFEKFDEDLYIPKGYAGKKILTYSDSGISGTFTDYLGNVCSFNEKSYVHMDEGDYSLNLADQFVEYLKGVVDIEIG